MKAGGKLAGLELGTSGTDPEMPRSRRNGSRVNFQKQRNFFRMPSLNPLQCLCNYSSIQPASSGLCRETDARSFRRCVIVVHAVGEVLVGRKGELDDLANLYHDFKK